MQKFAFARSQLKQSFSKNWRCPPKFNCNAYSLLYSETRYNLSLFSRYMWPEEKKNSHGRSSGIATWGHPPQRCNEHFSTTRNHTKPRGIIHSKMKKIAPKDITIRIYYSSWAEQCLYLSFFISNRNLFAIHCLFVWKFTAFLNIVHGTSPRTENFFE